jgi:hypothetical protein
VGLWEQVRDIIVLFAGPALDRQPAHEPHAHRPDLLHPARRARSVFNLTALSVYPSLEMYVHSLICIILLPHI